MKFRRCANALSIIPISHKPCSRLREGGRAIGDVAGRIAVSCQPHLEPIRHFGAPFGTGDLRMVISAALFFCRQ